MARIAARATRVGTALQEATALRAQARSVAVTDLVAWAEALAAAPRAGDLFEPGLDPVLRRQFESLQAALAAEKTEAEAAARTAATDRRLLDRIVDIRSQWVDSYDERACEAGYARTFREAGIDVMGLTPEEAAARIRAHRPAVALELASVVDHWADMRRFILGDPAGANHRLAVARAADPDPRRDQLRWALQERQGQERLAALQRLARSAVSDDLLALSLTLLGLGLRHHGDHENSEAVLRRTVRRHPREVWPNPLLAECLSSTNREEEAIRYYMVARFFRPETAHKLAQILANRGESDDALAIFRNLVEARPENGDHWACYGQLLKERGKLPEAIATGREAIRLKPDYAEAHCNLGRALREQGQYAESLAELRTGHQLGSKRPDWRYPSAAWVAQAEQLAVLAGTARPADAAKRAVFAQMAFDAKRYATATRL